MIYLDTNVFISALSPEEINKEAHAILVKIANGKVNAATSCLTWDELVWGLRKFFSKDIITKTGRNFLALPNLILLNVDSNVVSMAQTIVEKYTIAPRAALHAAAAIRNGAEFIISDDRDFDKIKEIKRLGIKEFNTRFL